MPSLSRVCTRCRRRRRRSCLRRSFFTLFIPDHAADQQTHDQDEYGDQNDIDKIGEKPLDHFGHILMKRAAERRG